MNFFFPIFNSFFKCKLTIPRFQNYNKTKEKYKVFSAQIKDNKWRIDLVDCDHSKNFFFLTDNNFLNNKIFFLAETKIGKKFFLDELKSFNNYTDTIPDYRANLSIEIKEGGFSSYQSDYPFDLTLKTGSVASPLSVLLNEKAEKNFIFFKNIFKLPVKNKFCMYFVDLLNNKVVHKENLLTNTTNQINVDKNFLKSNIYLYSDKYVGIPIFVSVKNKHLSMEHTHPPHLYIWGDDKFKRVQNLKKKINEIIQKNT